MIEIAERPIPTLENVELAEKVVAFLRANPDLWEQGNVLTSNSPGRLDQAIRCGTAGCVAGWAPLLDGKRIWNYHVESNGYLYGTLTEWSACALGLVDWHVAMDEDERHMFDADNTIEDLELWTVRIRSAYEAGTPVEAVPND